MELYPDDFLLYKDECVIVCAEHGPMILIAGGLLGVLKYLLEMGGRYIGRIDILDERVQTLLKKYDHHEV
jgi:hypothetical protein